MNRVASLSTTNDASIEIEPPPSVTTVTAPTKSDHNTINTDKTKTNKSVSKKKKRSIDNKSKEQIYLINLTTRISLTCFLSLSSSFTFQFLWLIGERLENRDILWTLWMWNIDGVINIFCVYFSMAFAKNHYKKICHDICKLHQCFLCCVMKFVDCQTKKKHKKFYEATL